MLASGRVCEGVCVCVCVCVCGWVDGWLGMLVCVPQTACRG